MALFLRRLSISLFDVAFCAFLEARKLIVELNWFAASKKKRRQVIGKSNRKAYIKCSELVAVCLLVASVGVYISFKWAIAKKKEKRK